MEITFADTVIIRQFEGYIPHVYKDQIGVLTCCWGLTGPSLREGTTFTQDECTEMFMKRINDFSSKLNNLIKTQVTKNQYIALLSLAFNIGEGAFGSSTLLKKVNVDPNDKTIEAQFKLWIHAGGKVLDDLVKRRAQEAALYFS